MVCPWWFCYSFDNPLRLVCHDPVRLLTPSVSAGMTAADIGCGMGFFSIGLAKLAGPGGRVIAVDLQQKMLAVLERRARRAGKPRIIESRIQQNPERGAWVRLDGTLAIALPAGPYRVEVGGGGEPVQVLVEPGGEASATVCAP